MNPIYPLEMQQQRVQGMVIVEAVVTPTGCIGSARVLTSVHPVLDAAAVRAVLQWEFTPTLVGTTPVPVLMTVTVKFTLM